MAPSDSPGSSGWGTAKGRVWTPFSYTLFTVQAVWGWGRRPQGGGGGQSHHRSVYTWDWGIAWWFAVEATEHWVGTGVLTADIASDLEFM